MGSRSLSPGDSRGVPAACPGARWAFGGHVWHFTGFRHCFNRALPHPGRSCSHLGHPVPTTAPRGLQPEGPPARVAPTAVRILFHPPTVSPHGAAASGAAGIKQQNPLLPDALAASPGFCLRQLSRSQIPSVGHVSARAGAAVAVSRAGPSLPFPSLAGGEQSHKNSKSPVWEARRARLVAVRIMRNIWSGWWEQLGAGCQGGRRGRCAPGTGTAGMDPSLPGATGPPVPAGAWEFTFPSPMDPKTPVNWTGGRGLCHPPPAHPGAKHCSRFLG